jgi:hypothetical protein
VSYAVEGPAVAIALAVVCSLYQNQRTVISTEAAHAFVSSRAEKSASLPELYPNQLIPLPLSSPHLFFAIFRPKIACQVQNHLTPTNKRKNTV